MKVPAALLTLALAGAAAAQGTPDLPPCAQDCASDFLLNGIGDCGRDVTCICSNAEFLDQIACCLVGVCSPEDQAQAVSYAGGFCSAVGVNVPTAVTCAESAASTSTSGAASGTSTTAETTATPTGSAEDDDDNNDGDDAATTATGTTTESTNFGPRPTAAAGLGAIGGIIAAVALL